VLTALSAVDERLTTASGEAGVYLRRQSSMNQVRQHHESTELQYRLADRPVGLGWPHERAVRAMSQDERRPGLQNRDAFMALRSSQPGNRRRRL